MGIISMYVCGYAEGHTSCHVRRIKCLFWAAIHVQSHEHKQWRKYLDNVWDRMPRKLCRFDLFTEIVFIANNMIICLRHWHSLIPPICKLKNSVVHLCWLFLSLLWEREWYKPDFRDKDTWVENLFYSFRPGKKSFFFCCNTVNLAFKCIFFFYIF